METYAEQNDEALLARAVQEVDHRREMHRPTFAELPADLDETWQHGFVIAGMTHHTNPAELARAYRCAGDLVVEHARDRGEAWEIGYPALYLYRHAIELYLKAIAPPETKTHNLAGLTSSFMDRVQHELNTPVPDWFQRYLAEFAALDPTAEAFRFADERGRAALVAHDEAWVELGHLRDAVGLLAQGFENVLRTTK